MSSNRDRSVKVGGNITGSSVVTGDNNLVSTRMTQVTLPPPDKVDVKAELAALVDLLSKLNLPERGKFDTAPWRMPRWKPARARPTKEKSREPWSGLSICEGRG